MQMFFAYRVVRIAQRERVGGGKQKNRAKNLWD